MLGLAVYCEACARQSFSDDSCINTVLIRKPRLTSSGQDLVCRADCNLSGSLLNLELLHLAVLDNHGIPLAPLIAHYRSSVEDETCLPREVAGRVSQEAYAGLGLGIKTVLEGFHNKDVVDADDKDIGCLGLGVANVAGNVVLRAIGREGG